MLVGVASLPPSFPSSRIWAFYSRNRQNCVYFCNTVYQHICLLLNSACMTESRGHKFLHLFVQAFFQFPWHQLAGKLGGKNLPIGTQVEGRAEAQATTKGQTKSKCIYEMIVSSKIPTKKFLDFCPEIFVASWGLPGSFLGFLGT